MNTLAGTSNPIGATVWDGGTNFSLFSRGATGVELLFFDREDAQQPAHVIHLDPVTNHTYHYWHTFVPDSKPGQLYGYRVSGPADPARGMRFNSEKLLLDPYGRGVAVPRGYERQAASRPGDNTAVAMKSVVVDPGAYDWQGDLPLKRPAAQTIVYEMHVRGFTRHPSSGLPAEKAGTLCWGDRKDTVSARAGYYRGGAAAGLPVRPPG